ncbi:hypothetical protein [Isoptericola sp. NPDC057653]|uniref:hypothetical protein n=1 Tax=Isoptericola sp. NPDC057653 TaxID=3346195 RepID=UPI0036B50B7B
MSDPYQPYQPYSQPGQQAAPQAGGPHPQGYAQPGHAPADEAPGYPQPGYAQAGHPQAGYPQGAYPQGAYPQGGYAYGYPPEDPGKAMGIVGFVMAFLFAPAGIVLSAIGRSQSRRAGFPNPLATWGLWLSIVFTAVSVLYVLFFVVLLGFGLFGAATYGDYSSALTV